MVFEGGWMKLIGIQLAFDKVPLWLKIKRIKLDFDGLENIFGKFVNYNYKEATYMICVRKLVKTSYEPHSKCIKIYEKKVNEINI